MLHVFILPPPHTHTHSPAMLLLRPCSSPPPVTCPIHPCLLLSIGAPLPRPVPPSRPAQPLPQRGPLQRPPPGVPRVPAGTGIRRRPPGQSRQHCRRRPRLRLRLRIGAALISPQRRSVPSSHLSSSPTSHCLPACYCVCIVSL